VAKLDPAQSKKYPVTPPALLSCIDGSAAKCDDKQLTNAGVCVQQPVQLTSPGSECGIAVSFQYPYQFWLPFTSLNKQRIFLQGQARMRLESQ
jgi:hypothetical protein